MYTLPGMKIFIVFSLIALLLPASSASFANLVGNCDQSLSENPNITTSTTTQECTYRIEVQTGTLDYAGTDARISLRLGSPDNATVLSVRDLESWGQMGDGYDYFEKGNLDLFDGIHQCVPTVPPCTLLLESDGTGYKPAWYVDYVSVVQSAGDLEFRLVFQVKQWLATDKPPKKLYAYLEDCGNKNATIASA